LPVGEIFLRKESVVEFFPGLIVRFPSNNKKGSSSLAGLMQVKRAGVIIDRSLEIDKYDHAGRS
jgi:hypothetical protein